MDGTELIMLGRKLHLGTLKPKRKLGWTGTTAVVCFGNPTE